MDPCPFVRILVGNLGLKFPAGGNTGSSTIYQCKIKLKNFATQFSSVALVQESQEIVDQINACFSFNESELEKIFEKSASSGKPYSLKIGIYNARRGNTCGGLKSGKLLGNVWVPLEFKGGESRGCLIQNGWVGIGYRAAAAANEHSGPQLHVKVKAEPDPRFVFEFEGEPECSPQVFQVNGNARQPVFTCKFSFRNPCCERNLRSRASVSEPSNSTSCFTSLTSFNPNKKEQTVKKERKGWSVTIHDLSGSAVAAASMVTPFVPSPGTDKVSKSNPGAWLILRPAHATWKPWGRLEAWRNLRSTLGYRFDLIPDGSVGHPVTVANSTLCTKTGGKFIIDFTTGPTTPFTSPSSSLDLSSGFGSGSGAGSWSGSDVGTGSCAQLLYKGFVMSSTVDGDGKCSRPAVEVGVQHVACTEDAAAFVALAAAMDLSMDACRSFSQKLPNELRQPGQE